MSRHIRVQTQLDLEPVVYTFYDMDYEPGGYMKNVREYKDVSIASQMRLEDIVSRNHYVSHDGTRFPVNVNFRVTHNRLTVWIHPDVLSRLINIIDSALP